MTNNEKKMHMTFAIRKKTPQRHLPFRNIPQNMSQRKKTPQDICHLETFYKTYTI